MRSQCFTNSYLGDFSVMLFSFRCMVRSTFLISYSEATTRTNAEYRINNNVRGGRFIEGRTYIGTLYSNSKFVLSNRKTRF